MPFPCHTAAKTGMSLREEPVPSAGGQAAEGPPPPRRAPSSPAGCARPHGSAQAPRCAAAAAPAPAPSPSRHRSGAPRPCRAPGGRGPAPSPCPFAPGSWHARGPLRGACLAPALCACPARSPWPCPCPFPSPGACFLLLIPLSVSDLCLYFSRLFQNFLYPGKKAK